MNCTGNSYELPEHTEDIALLQSGGEVRRGADPDCPGKYTLRCCCGKEMVREEQLLFAEPKRAAKQA